MDIQLTGPQLQTLWNLAASPDVIYMVNPYVSTEVISCIFLHALHTNIHYYPTNADGSFITTSVFLGVVGVKGHAVAGIT